MRLMPLVSGRVEFPPRLCGTAAKRRERSRGRLRLNRWGDASDSRSSSEDGNAGARFAYLSCVPGAAVQPRLLNKYTSVLLSTRHSPILSLTPRTHLLSIAPERRSQ